MANAFLVVAAVQWLGCAAPTTQEQRQMHAYVPQKVTKPIDATGTRVAVVTEYHSGQPGTQEPAPAMLDQVAQQVTSTQGGPSLLSQWQGQAANGEDEARDQGIAYVMLDDVVGSDLFANAEVINRIPPDLPRAQALGLIRNSDVEVRFTLTGNSGTVQVIDPQSGRVLKVETYTAVADVGTLMLNLKTALCSDFAGFNLKEACLDNAHVDPNNLDSLLVSHDFTIEVAKERNRALVAANTEVLPGLLQTSKTAALVELKVKLEQAILDLEHFSELAKEDAEATASNGGNSRDQREMSLLYRERVAILKPMLASVGEEIANRKR